MARGFNKLPTLDRVQNRLRRTSLIQAGAVLATAAAVFAGCGSSGNQQTNRVRSGGNAPTNTNPGQGGPIESVCDIQTLKATVAGFFGYSEVQCTSLPTKPGYLTDVLRENGNPSTDILPGSVEVSVQPDQTVFYDWTDPRFAESQKIVQAPDINGNPALWSNLEAALATVYGSQELNVSVPLYANNSAAQSEQFAVKVASLIENYTAGR